MFGYKVGIGNCYNENKKLKNNDNNNNDDNSNDNKIIINFIYLLAYNFYGYWYCKKIMATFNVFYLLGTRKCHFCVYILILIFS